MLRVTNGCTEKLVPACSMLSELGAGHFYFGRRRVNAKVGVPQRDEGGHAKQYQSSILDPKDFSPRWAKGRPSLNFARMRLSFRRATWRIRSLYSKGRVKIVVISEQGKEAVVGILETGHDPGSVGILSGRALVSLRFSPGSPVGDPLNELESNELSLMPNRKSIHWPNERLSSIARQGQPSSYGAGKSQRTPLPKDQQARADAVRTANARIMRCNSLWKQRLAQKR